MSASRIPYPHGVSVLPPLPPNAYVIQQSQQYHPVSVAAMARVNGGKYCFHSCINVNEGKKMVYFLTHYHSANTCQMLKTFLTLSLSLGLSGFSFLMIQRSFPGSRNLHQSLQTSSQILRTSDKTLAFSFLSLKHFRKSLQSLENSFQILRTSAKVLRFSLLFFKDSARFQELKIVSQTFIPNSWDLRKSLRNSFSGTLKDFKNSRQFSETSTRILRTSSRTLGFSLLFLRNSTRLRNSQLNLLRSLYRSSRSL